MWDLPDEETAATDEGIDPLVLWSEVFTEKHPGHDSLGREKYCNIPEEEGQT